MEMNEQPATFEDIVENVAQVANIMGIVQEAVEYEASKVTPIIFVYDGYLSEEIQTRLVNLFERYFVKFQLMNKKEMKQQRMYGADFIVDMNRRDNEKLRIVKNRYSDVVGMEISWDEFENMIMEIKNVKR